MPDSARTIPGDPRSVEDCAFAHRTIEAEGFRFTHSVVCDDGTRTDFYLHRQDLRSGKIVNDPDGEACSVLREVKHALH